MADIQFEEPRYAQSSPPKISWLTGLVIKTGLARDDAGAQKALLVVLILTIIAIVLIWVL